MNRAAFTNIPGSAAPACAFEAELDYVYRMFRRLGAQPSEAEDLTQDVFLVMWRRWRDFRPDRPIRPWLAGIAHHVALDYFRKHSRRELPTEVIEQEDQAPTPDDQLASARARRLALRALSTLPERYRSILIRHELDGVSLREIAEEWSLPLATAASRLRRARLRFAKAVKQLQLRGAAGGWALLPAQVVLEAERLVPPLADHVRARLRERLATRLARDGSAAPTAAPAGHLRPALRWPPLAPAIVGLAVVVAVALLLAFALSPRQSTTIGAPRATELARKTQPPRPTLPPPRLAPAPAPALRLTTPGERRSTVDGLARGLLGHWRFEDGPGSIVAADSSGNGRPCLLHELDAETAWVEGRVGGALDLGRRGWLECPMPEARAGVPLELSVSAWIKPVAVRWRESALVTRQLRSAEPKHLFWFGIRDSALAVWSWSWAGWTTKPLRARDSWMHVAFVHRGRETRLYMGGALVQHNTNQLPRGEGVVLVQSPLTIGAMRFRADPLRVRHHFDGLVDEVRIYDRALTDGEVAALAVP